MKNTPHNSRRNFIGTLAKVGIASALLPQLAWAFPNEANPKVARIVRRTLGIDTHNHVDVPLYRDEISGYNVPLAQELRKSGLAAIVMTFAVDYQKLTEKGQAYERFLTGLEVMDNILKANQMSRALSFADIKKAHKKGQPIVIQSVEGCHFLEGDAKRLQEAYNRGVRHLGLLHDNDATPPLGDVFTNPPQFGGLTAFGAEVIKEAERLGMLIDLAHCDSRTVDMALEVATKPVIISHTGSNKRLGKNDFMNKMMMPRLISDSQAKQVASKGGVIGVWEHLAENPLEYAQNIKYLADLVGIDHICIGTDTKLTPEYQSPRDMLAFQQMMKEKQEKEGKKDEQKPPMQKREPKTTNTLWGKDKDGFYYQVVKALLQVGFSENDIAKIGGGNYGRVFSEAVKG